MRNQPFKGLAEALAAKAQSTVWDNVKLHPDTVAKAEEKARMMREKKHSGPRRRTGPQAVTVKVDPMVMETALELAGGDRRRITLSPDGSATVWNKRRPSQAAETR